MQPGDAGALLCWGLEFRAANCTDAPPAWADADGQTCADYAANAQGPPCSAVLLSVQFMGEHSLGL